MTEISVMVAQRVKQVNEAKRKGKLTVDNEALFKCELKRFEMRDKVDYSSDLISRMQFPNIKEFKSITEVTVRKADKSNTLVVLNTTGYFDKLDGIVSDTSKFLKVERDPTDALKKSLNGFMDAIKLHTNEYDIPKLVGEFSPAGIYMETRQFISA